MRILVCDDEQLIINQIRKIVSDENDLSAEIESFNSAGEIVEFCKSCPDVLFDVIIMDILVGDENGIELSLLLNSKFPDAKIIFISGHPRFSQDIFLKIKPYGFIAKPIEPNILLIHLKNIAQQLNDVEHASTFKIKGKDVEIIQSKIRFIKSNREKITIHTTEMQYSVYEKLNVTEKKLDERFVRCHQSHIVNLFFVKEFAPLYFTMYTGEKIPISRARKKNSMEQYFKVKGGLI